MAYDDSLVMCNAGRQSCCIAVLCTAIAGHMLRVDYTRSVVVSTLAELKRHEC